MDLRITFENHPLLIRLNFIILLLKIIDENDQHLIVMIIFNGFLLRRFHQSHDFYCILSYFFKKCISASQFGQE